MKALPRFASAAVVAAMIFASVPAVHAQRSATWKASGLPNTTSPASNYIGRSDNSGRYNNYGYSYGVRRPQAYAYNYAPAYRPAPRYYSAPPAYIQPAPQYVGPGVSDETRRTFSAQPGGVPAPAQAPQQAPAK